MSEAWNPTDWQVRKQTQRGDLRADLLALLAEGKSQNEAARILRISAATASRLRKDEGDLMPGRSTGRPSVAMKLEAEVGTEAFQGAIAEVKGHNLDMKSNSGAWRWCASMRPLPAPIAAVVSNDDLASKHNLPRSLTALTKITRVQEHAKHGPRRLRLHGSSVPRRVEVLPGDIYVPDDTTPIWGCWVDWPVSKEYPYGVKLVQGQLLLLIDYASMYRVAYCLVVREGGSYRAVDIWGFFGDVFDSVGLPRLGFQLEGGSWRSNLIRGAEVSFAKDEASHERRVAGLTTLPTSLLPYHHELAKGGDPLPSHLKIWPSILPKTKPVEQAFRMMQQIEGTIWGYLGSDQQRAPIEATKRKFQRCQAGREDPRLHFLSVRALREKLDPILEYLNHDKMEGPVRQGRPHELWTKSLEAAPLLRIPADRRWLYRRSWFKRKIEGAFVNTSLVDAEGNRVPVSYSNPEAFAQHDGEDVIVYFDEQNIYSPAEIVALNGQHMCSAEFFAPTAAFIGGNRDGYALSQRYFSTVVAMTSIIAKRSPSRQLPPSIAAYRQADQARRREEQRTEFGSAGSRGHGAKTSWDAPAGQDASPAIEPATPSAPSAPKPKTDTPARRPTLSLAEMLSYGEPQAEKPAAPAQPDLPTSAPRRSRPLTQKQLLEFDNDPAGRRKTPARLAPGGGESAQK